MRPIAQTDERVKVDNDTLAQLRCGVFELGHLAAAVEFFRRNGFAVLRGLWAEREFDLLDDACSAAQGRLARGELDKRYGTRAGFDPTDERDSIAGDEYIPNYVLHVTEVDPVIREAVLHPVLLGLLNTWLAQPWLLEGGLFGVVLQHARSGPDSNYSRIGWHSDWQSGPHLDRWPSVAFTVHLDPTSPANGFLRVVPGSHLWATPAPASTGDGAALPAGSRSHGGHGEQPPPYPMPPGFERIPDEYPVFCERGDVLFHDAYLWHSAARGTDDDASRRHVRGGWFSGVPDQAGRPEDFVKNARR
jgi:hypothetical protein